MSSGERAAFAGQITDLPVSELLRTVVHGKQTGLARFETNLGSATLWFREGSIIDADMGRFHMGAAVRRLLTADTGTFEIEFKPISRRRLIKEETQLLLDSVEPPPPPELASSSRMGPRRARPAPGWTPTAGGKGATTRELPLPADPSASDSAMEKRETLQRGAFAETRQRLEELGRSSRRPSDEALHATAPIGAIDDEDDNLTRVARLSATPFAADWPMAWGDRGSPSNGNETDAAPALQLDRQAVPRPVRDVDSSPGDTMRAPVDDDEEPSASATAMGYSLHATSDVSSAARRVAALPTAERTVTPARGSSALADTERAPPFTPPPTTASQDTARRFTPPPSSLPTKREDTAKHFTPLPGPLPTPAEQDTAPAPGPTKRATPPPDSLPTAAPVRPAIEIRGRTRIGLPGVDDPPSTQARVLAPKANVPSEPRRIGGTAKMPVQEPPTAPRRAADPKSDGAPMAIVAEDYSDPIPIGTTWDAPSHLTDKGAADGTPTSARGEIRRRGAAPDRTVVPFAPSLPFQKTTADRGGTRPPPSSGATVTDGFRPLAKPKTDSYPTVEPSDANVQRASSIAATIGLDPSTISPGGSSRITAPGGSSAPGDSPTSSVGLEPILDDRTPRPTAAAPAVVGRYEVLLRIARGGMGTVYLCRVTGAGGFRRLFALKVIRDHLSRNAEYVTMLLQEARIASRLHHPNVVGIVDIGTLANQHYLVMDYVEGCTFSELLKVHRKSRPPQLMIPIVLDALTGLHAAHTLVNDDGSPLTLVHCDFSPQNILVGTNGICRITDFGIARASNALPERSSITRGKPAYLAPEQVLGRPFDHRADVFAAGVVLWNALTGEQLFGGETPEEMLEKVLHRPIQPPSAVGLRPPRSLDRVVLKALQRDPDMRYQTAEEMLIDLRRVAITEDLLAPASEVSRWVLDTFGAQLELRRQAAGIVAKPGPSNGSESREVAVPELGLGAEASATHAMVHTGSDTQADDMESRTVMLHTGGELAAADGEAAAMLGRRQRNAVFAIAATMAGVALALAFMRPGWLLGGFLDEDGTYFEPDPPIELPAVVEGPNTETTKAPGETKAGETKASETKATDVKAPGGGEAKALEPGGEAIEGKAPIDDGKAPPIEEATPTPTPEPEPTPEPTPTPEPKSERTPKPEATPKSERPPKAKTTPKPPRPEPEPAPPEPTPEETKPDPKPVDPIPSETPEPDPPKADPPKPPKKDPPAEQPSLPKPPDLKELLEGDS